MVPSVAVLSDVHGVLPMLDAVLAEPAVAEADLIVVTGDHASGPQPAEVLDRLIELGDRAVLVRGNADQELVSLAVGENIDIPGTPRSDTELVLVDSSLERWADVLSAVPEKITTIVCGHTHMPFTRLVDRRLVVNPGSVGMPYGRPGGHWALRRDGAVTLGRVEIDLDSAISSVVAGSRFPGREEWAECFLRAQVSDAKALRLFGPASGGQPDTVSATDLRPRAPGSGGDLLPHRASPDL